MIAGHLAVALTLALPGAVSASVPRFFAATDPIPRETEHWGSSCSKPAVRMEWRELSKTQQQAYLDAVEKLFTTKVKSHDGKEVSPADLFNAAHSAILADEKQDAFLPLNRLVLAAFDHLLAKHAKYTGPLPYWDTGVDSQAPAKSPVLKSIGRVEDVSGKPCVFIDKTRLMRSKPSRDCVQRDTDAKQLVAHTSSSTSKGAFYSNALIDTIIRQGTSFQSFAKVLFVGPVLRIQNALGGDMKSPKSAANDPLFVLHRRNIDRIWDRWQDVNKKIAKSDGSTTAALVKKNLDKVLEELGISFKLTDADLINIQGTKLCYKYSDSILAKNAAKTASVKDAVFRHGFKRDGSTGASREGDDGVYHGSPSNRRTPGAHDTSDYYNLRHVEPLPDDFLREWGMSDADIDEVRSIETHYRDMTDYINAQDGFVAPSALVNVKSAETEGWRGKTEDDTRSEDQTYQRLADGSRRYLGTFDDVLNGGSRGSRENDDGYEYDGQYPDDA
ncbi:hypothetical protein HK105_202814 [Polyrhizophydium stewartii]|uniref:Tyrosinase copper-binding domain-containing protein n=1 Tax=Polyrhizophydium stewartii TaxID=2732419 RepID=A0ABR4NDE5_9FUNG|nr:hypothetical protein HK105_007532 [Polyrhizophydium stewartii]